MEHILCIDDNENFLFGLKVQLAPHYRVLTAGNEIEAFECLSRENIDLALVDVHLGREKNDGIAFIKKLKTKYPTLMVIMLSGHRDPQLIVESVKCGANDYLCKPYPTEELKAVIQKNLATRHVLERNAALIEMYNDTQVTSHRLIGAGSVMRRLCEQIIKVRGHNTTILIEGESGTGKEVLAKHIHALESDARRPFIAVNCAAIPETLIESELFGHEKGSFTGADKRKLGKFELANGGDLFLDEINSLKPDLQAKLLRVLQDKSFYRVGGVVSIQSTARVIVASNRNLDKEVEAGRFRGDLLYRLRVISFKIAPLRDRIEDLPELIDFFVAKHFGNRSIKFSDEVKNILKKHSWPGNVRELENLIQSLVIMATGDEVKVSELPEWLVQPKRTSAMALALDRYIQQPQINFCEIDKSLKDYTRAMEVEFIKNTIKAYEGNVMAAARSLKISKSKLYWTLAQDPQTAESRTEKFYG